MKKLFYSLALIGLFACNTSNNQEKNSPEINIDQPFNSKDTVSLKNIHYIPLETKKYCQIGEVSKILFQHDTYYILDKITKSILAFNRDGKFLYKISKLGHGPGEYIEPLDFDVDSEDNIYVWDNGTRKIIKYSDSGAAFTETNLKKRFFEFGIIGNAELLLHRVFDEGGVSSTIGFYNTANNSLKEELAGRKYYDDPSVLQYSNQRLYKSGDVYSFYQRFSNSIYTVSDGKLHERFSLKTKSLPPPEFIEKNYDNIEAFLRDIKYVKDIINIYETPDFFTMSIVKTPRKTNILFDKKSNKALILDSSARELTTGTAIRGVNENEFFSLVSPAYFSKDDFQKNIALLAISDQIKHKLMSLYENANPVIVQFEYVLK